MVYGTFFQFSTESTLLLRMFKARVLTLGHMVEVCGLHLDNAASLASRLGLKSVRLVSLRLRTLKDHLTDFQLKMVCDFYDGFI